MDELSYTVYKRQSTGKWYAEFRKDDKKVKSVTLKATSRRAAVLEAKQLLDAGAGLPGETVPEYCMSVWTEGSEYIRLRRMRLKRGSRMSAAYIENSYKIAKTTLAEFFSGVAMKELDAEQVEGMMLALHERGLSGRSVNIILQVLTVAYNWYCKKNRMPSKLVYLEKANEEPKRGNRGSLTITEIQKIIALEVQDERIKCAVLLGCLCGMRAGEIRGLQWEDIKQDEGIIEIQHNYTNLEGLLDRPKCGSTRVVPLPEQIKPSLDAIAKLYGKVGYVIPSISALTPGKPVTTRTLDRWLEIILDTIGIPKEEQKERNLVFHGLRHTFVTLSRTLGLSDFVAQRLAGHKSMKMTEKYSHSDMLNMKAIGEQISDALSKQA